jgi:hypothetical protein
MENSGQEPTQLLQLPDTDLLRVLQRLATNGDVNHRSLFSAARAHSRLHAAAAAALSALQVEVDSQQQADGVLCYLARHGQHVTSVSVPRRRRDPVDIRQLSRQCWQVCSLSFHTPQRQLPHHDDCGGLQLQLGPSSSHQGVLQSCSAQLTRLELDGCRLLDASAAVTTAALEALTGLRHLTLRAGASSWRWGRGLPCELWSALSRLTHLNLNTGLLADDAWASGPDGLQFISCLVHLQELKLDCHFCDDQQSWYCEPEHVFITPAVVSGMERLTRLELVGFTLEAAVLASIGSRLRHLELWHTLVVVSASQPQHQVEPMFLTWQPDLAAGAVALLAQLGSMQQLTTLRLEHFYQRAPSAAAAAYSALTASSGLRRLGLTQCRLPPGAWQHVFGAERQRTALERLDLGETHAAATSDDIAALVGCCPGLHALSLPRLVLEAGAQLQPLLRLVHLTSLSMQDLHAAGAGIVAQLSMLRQLEVGQATEAALLPLTQLRGLTRVKYGFKLGWCQDWSTKHIHNKVGWHVLGGTCGRACGWLLPWRQASVAPSHNSLLVAAAAPAGPGGRPA